VILLAIFGLLGPATASAAPADDLVLRLLAPTATDAAPCCAGRPLVESQLTDVWRLRFGPAPGADGSATWVRITARDEAAQALGRTRSFDVSYEGTGDARAVRLAEAVAARVAAHDPGGLSLGAATGSSGGPALDAPSRLDAAGVGLAFLLLLAVVLFAVPLGAAGLPCLVDALGGGRRARWAVLGLLGLSLGLRLAAPQRLVTYYMGYRAVAEAAAFEAVPKYGPAAYLPYHLLFRLTGPSHAAWIALDQVLGALTPLAGAWLLALFGAGRLGVAAGGLLLAATPLFVKDAASESAFVPALIWLLLGLGAALLQRARPRAWLLEAALAGLGLAMLARPEALVLAPVTLLVLWPLGPARATGWRATLPAVVLAALVAVGAVRGVQLAGQIEAELALGNTSQLAAPFATWVSEVLGQGLFACNAALWPSLFPLPVTLLALAAPLVAPAGRRRTALALLGLALAWIAAARADLPYLSVPRLQAPGLVLLTLAAALGLEGAWGRLAPRLGTPALRRGVAALGVAAVVASAVATLPRLSERTNADDEEAAFAEAVALLPRGPVTLLVRTGAEEPREPGHFHYPLYLAAARGVDLRVRSLDEARQHPLWDRPVYAWLGTRCALRACDQAGEHPACRAVRADLRLEPVLTRTVPVRRPAIPDVFHRERVTDPAMQQDLDFPWCVPKGDLTLALYRVLPPPDAAR